MKTIRLIHWKAAETGEKINKLSVLGYRVEYDEFRGPSSLRQIQARPPAAFVIDLSRLPSQGRDVALVFRENKITRFIPIVFVGGIPEKIARVKETLPDACYTDWEQIGEALAVVIKNPPQNPVIPKSRLDGYSGTPLPKKLGIKSNSVVTLINSPDNFELAPGDLPENVRIEHQLTNDCGLIVWFTLSKNEIQDRIKNISKALNEKGSVWIAWPKKASGTATDITQNEVRQIGLANGLVDYKICSIDQTWSGLRFAKRKPE